MTRGEEGAVSVDTQLEWLEEVGEVERRIAVIDDAIGKLGATIERLSRPVAVSHVDRRHDSGASYKEKAGRYAKNVLEATYFVGYAATLLLAYNDAAYSVLWYFFLGFVWPLIIPFNALMRPLLLVIMLCGLGVAVLVSVVILMEGAADKDLEDRAARLASEREQKAAQDQTDRNRAAIPTLDSEIALFEKTKSSLESRLETLYSSEYLHPSMRGMAPVLAMAGYLATGRCFSLYGPGGAIDTYVHDSQFDLLNKKLDVIVSRLDDLRRGQVLLAQALDRNADEIQRLSRAMGRFEASVGEGLSAIGDGISAQGNSLSRIAECEEYRTACLRYVNAHQNVYPVLR